jgi:hypothetical protein
VFVCVCMWEGGLHVGGLVSTFLQLLNFKAIYLFCDNQDLIPSTAGIFPLDYCLLGNDAEQFCS